MASMFHSLANKLTLSRILVIPVILLLLLIPQGWAAWLALLMFVAAGVTDLLDGYLARRDGQVSLVGQFLDPIADKLLVAAVILFLVYNGEISGFTLLPAVIILLREVAVSGLRELLSAVQVGLPVSRLAKAKTLVQIVALSFLIVGHHPPDIIPATAIGDFCLWIAGALTVVTAWDYWRAIVKHFESQV
jgi:cardiolipin synthase (CMP-forming)